MKSETMNAGLPAPQFREAFGGFEIIFNKDIYSEEYLKEQGLNERQVMAVFFIRKNGRITNSDYQKINNISERSAIRDITSLLSKKIITKWGSGKNTEYRL